MIQGKTPEMTIKFSSLPDLPTEGKKVTLEILSENNLKIKAELNRKTLKKQVSKIGETHLIAEIITRIRFEPDQKSVMSLVITLKRSPAQ